MKNPFKRKIKPCNARSIIKAYNDPIWWNKTSWSHLGCVSFNIHYSVNPFSRVHRELFWGLMYEELIRRYPVLNSKINLNREWR